VNDSFKQCCNLCSVNSRLGGLVVSVLASSNPAEGDGFLRAIKYEHDLLRRGSKAVGPMS
jgi:hypothetical protein